MKALYIALQIILLAYAGFLLITQGNIILSILILLIALEKFRPLFIEFEGKKVIKHWIAKFFK